MVGSKLVVVELCMEREREKERVKRIYYIILLFMRLKYDNTRNPYKIQYDAMQ